jgi:hypothetical protein
MNPVSNRIKISLVGADWFHTDGQTDIHYVADSRFRILQLAEYRGVHDLL